MKKYIFIALIFTASGILFSECKKDNRTFKTFFWSGIDTRGEELTLFINNSNEGELPFFKDGPACENDTSKQRALLVELKAGSYKLKTTDKNGRIIGTGSISIGGKEVGVNRQLSDLGEIRTSSSGDCIIIGLL